MYINRGLQIFYTEVGEETRAWTTFDLKTEIAKPSLRFMVTTF